MRGETMRQRGHVSQMRRGQGSASESTPKNDTERYQPERLMFSRRRKLLRVNRRALELADHLDQAEIGRICEIHSAPVRELRNAIQTTLDHRRAAHIWEPFELKRVVFEGRRRILVRGLGLADRSSHDDSRIVIVLEELGLHQARRAPERPVMGLSWERRGPAIQRSAKQGGRLRSVPCVLVMVSAQTRPLEGPEHTSSVNKGSKMGLNKNDVPDVSQTSVSVMNGEDSRQPAHRRPAGLTDRVRGIDCLLADIQAQIQMLRRERTYLRLVRRELAGMKAKRRESSPCSTSSR
jgi:hypothetical protein